MSSSSSSYTEDFSPSSSKSSSTEQSLPKLDLSTLVKHGQSNRPPDDSRKVFINSWLASTSQTEIIENQECEVVIESDDDESSSVIAAQPSVPVIVFTGTNEAPNVASSTDAVPTINISEPEEVKAQTDKSAFRKRAKSYPAIEQQLIQPMLELPQRVVNQGASKNTASMSSKNTASMSSKNTGSMSSKEHAEQNMSKYAHVVVTARKWKKKAKEGVVEDLEEEATATRQKKRAFIEIPRALKLEVLEDAYPIVQATYQMYKSYLGSKHKLSVQAEQHLKRLSVQLGKNSTSKST
ncbi:uncharacterized protein LOC135349144 [Halichondria panicea]|uniref:uncharacterized protein LOC135349144 n=1 Tax=Halichondria panicea TaxID=6063 RepID=UPI00312B3F13